MHLAHIRKSDLNLLPALAVLLEERSISKAADRHHLSQPAMSRVLQRLRGVFGDQLLVRTRGGYALTARARRLQEELRLVLPRIDSLLRGDAFDPATAEERFRLCCPDYLSRLFAPRLAERLSDAAPRSTLEIVPWHENAVEDVARGRIDAMLRPNRISPPLHSEEILRSEMVCVMSLDHPLAKRRLTMKSYLAYPHVRVSVMTSESTMVDEQLTAAGHHRRIGLRVPYFGSAVLAVENTELIATVPRMAAQQYMRELPVYIASPPFKFEPIRILMSWHPSTHREPALQWFRALVRDVGATLK
ncbi:MAG: LysR family transcriptional regulator [Hyphomicrobiaceae bacterium]